MEVTAPGGDGGEPGISDRGKGDSEVGDRGTKIQPLKIKTYRNANQNVRNFCGNRPIRTI